GGGVPLEGHVADGAAKVGEAHLDEAVPELCHGRPRVVGLGGRERRLLWIRRRCGSAGLRGDLLGHLVPDLGGGGRRLRMLLVVEKDEERRDEQQRADECVLLVHAVAQLGLRRAAGTGSLPPGWRGVHLTMRRAASQEPLRAPWVLTASAAYWEHVG